MNLAIRSTEKTEGADFGKERFRIETGESVSRRFRPIGIETAFRACRIPENCSFKALEELPHEELGGAFHDPLTNPRDGAAYICRSGVLDARLISLLVQLDHSVGIDKAGISRPLHGQPVFAARHAVRDFDFPLITAFDGPDAHFQQDSVGILTRRRELFATGCAAPQDFRIIEGVPDSLPRRFQLAGSVDGHKGRNRAQRLLDARSYQTVLG